MLMRGASMPTKHIDDKTWKIISDETLKQIKKKNKMVKESEVLKELIEQGIIHIKEKKAVKKITVMHESDRRE